MVYFVAHKMMVDFHRIINVYMPVERKYRCERDIMVINFKR